MAVVRLQASQERPGRLPAVDDGRQDLELDVGIRDPVPLNVERSSKVRHIKRLLVEAPHELLERRSC